MSRKKGTCKSGSEEGPARFRANSQKRESRKVDSRDPENYDAEGGISMFDRFRARLSSCWVKVLPLLVVPVCGRELVDEGSEPCSERMATDLSRVFSRVVRCCGVTPTEGVSASGVRRRGRGGVNALGAGARRTIGDISSIVDVLDDLPARGVHALAARQAVPPAGVAAAHGRVEALVAPPTPGLLEVEGLELLLVLFCDRAAVLGRGKRLPWLIPDRAVALRVVLGEGGRGRGRLGGRVAAQDPLDALAKRHGGFFERREGA